MKGDRRYKRETAVKKALCVILYSLGKASFSMKSLKSLAHLSVDRRGQDPRTQHFWQISRRQSSMKCSIFFKKSQKLWVIKDRSRTIACVTGDATTFKRLFEKVESLENCRFYTDDWDAFAKILPKNRHVIGKSGTVCIEHNNSNTRHDPPHKNCIQRRGNGYYKALVRSYNTGDFSALSGYIIIYL
ncbi:IS1 transposase [Candidatus Cyrtobacter comes]|uniref:IS1 transposase n=2 Tax=Candidatus Cyrtobacter comes TaxID=675776 RepID=A0ABU5L6L5_9RICK|nr:IS1 family transposase [Candidatus Cyrtobacter comes]MDZ5761763.1 IS1 transposase [Candidatus Cyrtobacter comes]